MDEIDPRANDNRDRESADPRDDGQTDPREVFTKDLDLPRGPEREHVRADGDDYRLRGSEVRALSTVGAFRAVPADDLRDDGGRAGDVRHGDLERLKDAGLKLSQGLQHRFTTLPSVIVALYSHSRM